MGNGVGDGNACCGMSSVGIDSVLLVAQLAICVERSVVAWGVVVLDNRFFVPRRKYVWCSGDILLYCACAILFLDIYRPSVKRHFVILFALLFYSFSDISNHSLYDVVAIEKSVPKTYLLALKHNGYGNICAIYEIVV